MHRQKNKGFTLIEVIISIIILSVVSAVLLRLFMTADHLNVTANDKSIASVLASNSIEDFSADTDDYNLYFDKDWQEVTADDDWAYTLAFTSTKGDFPTLFHLRTEIHTKGGKTLLLYETSRYIEESAL